MSIIQRILTLLEQQDKRMIDLARYLHISNSNITNWKLRHTNPPAKYIMKICYFFAVSPEYLLTGITPKASRDETELLNIYRKSDKDGRTMIMASAIEEKRRHFAHL